ncbi:hypothetical protein [Brevundimonas sp.]|uniref:hypothetical protein n=1 Tax=Brevundimonas sp. TaxID=1871086 RepID=UPI003F70CA8F
MIAALIAAALASAPMQSDQMTRDVVMDFCLPYVNGDSDRAAIEFLGFTVTGEEGAVTDLASSDDRQAYLLRLTADDGEDDGEVLRACELQARGAGFDAVKGAIQRPLEQAGFTAETVAGSNRLIWSRQGVTVSLRQSQGRAAVVRVSYSSLDAEGA